MGLFSVLMPFKRAVPFVRDALESVLAQDAVDLEVIIINDEPGDGSLAAVQCVADPRVQVIPGPSQGIAAALNRGLEVARGEFIARCDADDLYPPGRLAWQTAWLEDHSEFGAVCGFFDAITGKGRSVGRLGMARYGEEITEELRHGTTRTSLCTFAIRAAVLKEVGGFRAYFVTAEDIDLQLRLGEASRVWYEPKLAYIYRLHDASASHSQSREARVFYEATARAFQRQRQCGRPDDLEQGRAPAPPARQGETWPARDQVQGILVGSAWDAHARGQRLEALTLGLRACLVQPLASNAWKNLAALALKRRRNV